MTSLQDQTTPAQLLIVAQRDGRQQLSYFAPSSVVRKSGSLRSIASDSKDFHMSANSAARGSVAQVSRCKTRNVLILPLLQSSHSPTLRVGFFVVPDRDSVDHNAGVPTTILRQCWHTCANVTTDAWSASTTSVKMIVATSMGKVPKYGRTTA